METMIQMKATGKLRQHESYADSRELRLASTYLLFGRGCLSDSLDSIDVTHVVVGSSDLSRLSLIRVQLSRSSIPSLVASDPSGVL